MTQVLSSGLAPIVPAMCGSATLAMEESSTSIKVASVTVIAMTQGLIAGRASEDRDCERHCFSHDYST